MDRQTPPRERLYRKRNRQKSRFYLISSQSNRSYFHVWNRIAECLWNLRKLIISLGRLRLGVLISSCEFWFSQTIRRTAIWESSKARRNGSVCIKLIFSISRASKRRSMAAMASSTRHRLWLTIRWFALHIFSFAFIFLFCLVPGKIRLGWKWHYEWILLRRFIAFFVHAWIHIHWWVPLLMVSWYHTSVKTVVIIDEFLLLLLLLFIYFLSRPT